MDLLSSRVHHLLACAAVLAIVCLIGSPVRAQTSGNGSIYSQFGLGTLETFSSSQSQALGGGGYALRSLNYNATANPALWSDQVYTRLSAGVQYDNISSENSAGQSSQLDAGSVEAFQFSFPLYKRSLGFGLSFQPFTRHHYRSQTISDQTETGDAFTVNRRGTGGLHQVRGGFGYRISEALRVGAGVDVLFGLLERKRNTNFDAPSFQDTRANDATRLSGVSGTVGAHLAFADVLQDDDALSLGAAVDLPTTLHGTRTLTTEQTVSSDTIASADGDMTLPWSGKIGVAYQTNERWTFTVDGLFEPWSRFSSSFSGQGPLGTPVPREGEESLTDRWRVSAGTEVVPGGTNQYASFLSRIAYRMGAYTERLYIRPNNENLQTYAVTGGFSLPTPQSGTRIDLNLRVGTRGTASNGLVRDRFFGASLHVNFGEEWFKKRKLR